MLTLKNVNYLIFIIVTLLLSACSTVGTYQATCEQQNSKFSETVSCLKRNINNDPRFQGLSQDSDLVKLYLAYADELVEKVQHGQISETEARFQLATMYTKLKSQSFSRGSVSETLYVNQINN